MQAFSFFTRSLPGSSYTTVVSEYRIDPEFLAMGVNKSQAGTDKGSRMISTVVSPAVQLWLRSQVETVETLHFKLMGRDREILRGHIPTVSIAARRAVYQGLHLSQLQLDGTNIRFNLTQVFKGKPLRLLEPLPVAGQLVLQENDLQASLGAPLLSNALTDLLNTFIKSYNRPDQYPPLGESKMNWQQITLDGERLTLKGTLMHHPTRETSIVINAGIQLATPQQLRLHPLQIQINAQQPPITLEHFTIDLGSEVDLKEITLTPGQLICRGCIKIIP
ncbi:LmeA family phospholipid-binding protein [Coleofasciculus sp.]|uniref:LmeA family phospholipid-binding protein n=1 Tax=Coleofasciculus sp. TaxID=3100458 RepID=UPI0039F8377A